jgi:simple sugar transport system permease protein
MSTQPVATPAVKSAPPKSLQATLKQFLLDNMVTVLFLIICGLGLWVAGLPLSFVISDLIHRISRNGVLILALLIPVMAGMGLNFAITLGAMAGQLAILMVVHWEIGGVAGVALAAVLATPMAVLFGVLTGKLLNKTRGQEMITSMITGMFASGLYMLLLMVLVGSPLIPIVNPEILLGTGIGVKDTVDLAIMSRAVDDLWSVSFPLTGLASAALMLLYYGSKLLAKPTSKAAQVGQSGIKLGLIAAVIVAAVSGWVMTTDSLLNMVTVPIATFALIALVAIFNLFIITTKLGQDFRAVGQDQHIAKVSGINVDRTRIIAMTISTVLAAWGQLLMLQNLGNLRTYGAHEAVGMFAIAALLIGGASVSRATVGQALIGMVLFHTMFLVSPQAGKALLGDAQLGEFFRAFVAYGVIAASLAMHAWKRTMATRKRLLS